MPRRTRVPAESSAHRIECPQNKLPAELSARRPKCPPESRSPRGPGARRAGVHPTHSQGPAQGALPSNQALRFLVPKNAQPCLQFKMRDHSTPGTARGHRGAEQGMDPCLQEHCPCEERSLAWAPLLASEGAPSSSRGPAWPLALARASDCCRGSAGEVQPEHEGGWWGGELLGCPIVSRKSEMCPSPIMCPAPSL